jgi:Spy/CpxP family protein refolding chaperone
MFNKTVTWGLALALGGALLLSSTSHAADGANRWLGRLQTELQLNNDQVNAIQAIFARDAPTQRQLSQTLRQSEATLRQLALNGADEATLQQKMAEIEGLLAQGVQLRVKRLQEISPLLTPEQRERFAQLRPHGPHMRGAPGAPATPGPSS